MITTFDELVDEVIASAKKDPKFEARPSETIWEVSEFAGKHISNKFDFEAIVAEARKRFPEAKGVRKNTLTWTQLDELKAKIRPGRPGIHDKAGHQMETGLLLQEIVVEQVNSKLNLHSV